MRGYWFNDSDTGKPVVHHAAGIFKISYSYTGQLVGKVDTKRNIFYGDWVKLEAINPDKEQKIFYDTSFTDYVLTKKYFGTIEAAVFYADLNNISEEEAFALCAAHFKSLPGSMGEGMAKFNRHYMGGGYTGRHRVVGSIPVNTGFPSEPLRWDKKLNAYVPQYNGIIPVLSWDNLLKYENVAFYFPVYNPVPGKPTYRTANLALGFSAPAMFDYIVIKDNDFRGFRFKFNTKEKIT